jgi:hypothetical protein
MDWPLANRRRYDGGVIQHRVAIVSVVATAGLACATALREPWTIDSPSLKSTAVSRADWVASWPQALATVLDVFESHLGLPPLEVRLVFLPDDPTFERLLLEIGYSPALARDTVKTMTAIGGRRSVLLNESRMADDSWPARVGLLAHELTHVLQYELGGGVRGTSEQWLREGLADWVELQVLVELRAVEAWPVRADLLQRTRDADLPPLSALATFPSWVSENRARPDVDLYAAAQVAVDLLIDLHGIGAVLDYFGRFAVSQEREAHFKDAFGQTVDAFDAEFRQHLRGTLR